MHPLIYLFNIVMEIIVWIVIASAIMSWLVAFGVVNTRNQFVSAVSEFLYRITEPALRPIRRVVPLVGGFDISPIVLILLLIFARNLVFEYLI